MTFDAFEESVDDGQPVELYEWTGTGILVRETTALEQAEPSTGEIYTPSAIKRSGIIGSSDLAADKTITIDTPPDHPIAVLHVLTSPTSPIFLEIREFHRGDGNIEGLWKGDVRTVTWAGSVATITLEAIPRGLNHEGLPIGFQRTCPFQVYDVNTCRVVRATFTLAGTIATLSGITMTAAIFATQPDGWLTGGAVHVGAEERLITSHVGDTITLLIPFQEAVPGQAVTAEAGCDRLKATCDTKFSNLENHGGNPWMPDKNPFQVGLDG